MRLLQRKLCEINGVKYMSPSAAADLWNISTQKITAACKDGRIEGAILDSSDKWIIPVNARKPLEKAEIKTLLVGTLCLKNKPNTLPHEMTSLNIDIIYDYLYHTGYIEQFDRNSDRIPFDVILTDRGMKLATEGSTPSVNWVNAGLTIISIASDIITIWTAVNTLLPIT